MRRPANVLRSSAGVSAAGRGALTVVLALLLLVGAATTDAWADPVLDGESFVVAETDVFPRKVRIAHNPDRDEYLAVFVPSGLSDDDGPRALRLDSTGAALGPPVGLSEAARSIHARHTANVVHNPTNGEYFVLWTETRGVNPGQNGRVGFITAQRMSETGEPIGPNISITGFVGDTFFCGYGDSDVEFNPATGGYMAVSRLWYATSTAGAECGGLAPDTSHVEAFALTAAGATTATAVVPGSTTVHRSAVDIGHNPVTGEFMAVHTRPNPQGGDDTSATLAHRIDAAGEPIGPSITVIEPTGYAGGTPGHAAGNPVTGEWLVVAHDRSVGNVAHRFTPTGQALGHSGRFGGGNAAAGVAATADGRWVATDERGGLTEFGADGQIQGATAQLTSGGQRQVGLALLSGSDPVRGLGVWPESNPPSVHGIFFDLIPPLPERPPLEPGVRRLSGDGRIQTAVAISAATFQPGVPVAYLATAGGFPDALAAGPLAAAQGGPILLTGRDSLDDSTRVELARLQPERIAVLGGQGAVSAAVEQELHSFTAGPVSRLSGADRFQTAAAIVDEFEVGQEVVLVATGSSFPDALAGGAAAGLTGSPIVLVQQDSIPAVSRAALERLAPGRILLLGGTGAVSQEVFGELASMAPGGADRLSGSDRFATSAQIAELFPAQVDTVVVATGGNFPDALAGTPAAVLRGAPILLVTPSSIPDPIAAQLARLSPREVLVLGGSGAVDEQVLAQLRTYLRP